MESTQPEIVYLQDYRLSLGEACIWHEDLKCFLVSDMKEGKLYSVKVPEANEPLEKAQIFEHTLPQIDEYQTSISSMAPLAYECGIVCSLENHGFAIARITDNDNKFDIKIELTANPIKDMRKERMNDGRCSPDGRFFFAGSRI